MTGLEPGWAPAILRKGLSNHVFMINPRAPSLGLFEYGLINMNPQRTIHDTLWMFFASSASARVVLTMPESESTNVEMAVMLQRSHTHERPGAH